MPTVLELSGINASGLILQGESLAPLIYGKDPDLWKNRLTVSEGYPDYYNKEADASLFYKNWHVLFSRAIYAKWFRGRGRVRNFLRRSFERCPVFALGAVFDYLEDAEETRYTNALSFDLFFKYRAQRFLQKLRENNSKIRAAIIKNADGAVIVDPETQKRLRALGYLQ
jgi:hypothetical protein